MMMFFCLFIYCYFCRMINSATETILSEVFGYIGLVLWSFQLVPQGIYKMGDASFVVIFGDDGCGDRVVCNVRTAQ